MRSWQLIKDDKGMDCREDSLILCFPLTSLHLTLFGRGYSIPASCEFRRAAEIRGGEEPPHGLSHSV